MNPSSYDLKAFYNTREGRVIRRVLRERIEEIWPDCKGLRVMGGGYAVPYLKTFTEDAECIFALMPKGQGAHHWPSSRSNGDPANLVCLSERYEIPIETNSVDRVLIVHDLEYCEDASHYLAEIWRVLKSNGRLMVIVPNRSGLWTHADWSPFGHGAPFSASQLCAMLRENLFVHETTQEALFMPPMRYSAILKLARAFEQIGRKIMPMAAGVHIVEASKQLYATSTKGHGQRVREKTRRVMIPKPALNR